MVSSLQNPTHHNFHSVNFSSDTASADAAKFKDIFLKFILNEGYMPGQIFNVDKTVLYWKRMPEWSYIHKEAKTMPKLKTFKDRLTLLLGGNVTGYKLKPFMIYHSAKLGSLARKGKHMLHVHYRHNKKAQMTALLFEDWFMHCFIPEVKDYCRENSIPSKFCWFWTVLPATPAPLEILTKNVKVVFLPSNTTSLIQPMNQGALAMFKAYYLQNMFSQAVEAKDNEDKELRTFWEEFSVLNAILNIGRAWKEVTKECMNGIWKNLLKMYVNSIKGFDKDGAVVEINKKIVSLGKCLDLELEEEDIRKLIDVQDVEDLIEFAEEEEEIEEEPEQMFTIKAMAEAFASIEHGMKLFSKNGCELGTIC
ncbi:tigger transposable element-derived protein 1-like [Macrobrachium nipponense]|uniref:tigger transposable element-derived protein 1-like n=1 Tax=Macrobrachium nipponense TaxID=159736 RepID=UPI0030C832E5